MPLKLLGPDPHQIAAAEHPLGVLVAGQGGAALAGQLTEERRGEQQIRSEHAQRAAGVVVHATSAVIRPSIGSAPEWLDTSSAPPEGGQVLQPLHVDPEPALGQRPEQRQPSTCSVTSASKPNSSTSVVPGDAPSDEGQFPQRPGAPTRGPYRSVARRRWPPATSAPAVGSASPARVEAGFVGSGQSEMTSASVHASPPTRRSPAPAFAPQALPDAVGVQRPGVDPPSERRFPERLLGREAWLETEHAAHPSRVEPPTERRGRPPARLRGRAPHASRGSRRSERLEHHGGDRHGHPPPQPDEPPGRASTTRHRRR